MIIFINWVTDKYKLYGVTPIPQEYIFNIPNKEEKEEKEEKEKNHVKF